MQSESRDFAAFADQRAHDVTWMTAEESAKRDRALLILDLQLAAKELKFNVAL